MVECACTLLTLLFSTPHRTELHRRVIPFVITALIVAVVLLVVAMEVATVGFAEVAALVAAGIAAVAIEFAVAVETLALFAVAAISKLCGAAFLAGGVLPTALLAGFLRHDSDYSLLALLLLTLAVVLVFFALLAGEEFLALGLGTAA